MKDLFIIKSMKLEVQTDRDEVYFFFIIKSIKVQTDRDEVYFLFVIESIK